MILSLSRVLHLIHQMERGLAPWVQWFWYTPLSGKLRLVILQLALVLPAFLTLGCGTILPVEKLPVENRVDLPGGGSITALAPASLSRSLVATQRVQGRDGDRQFVLLCQLEVDEQRLAMVATTPMGSTLFSIIYSGDTLVTDVSPLLPTQFQPKYVLIDFQLVFWPLDVLNASLSREGLKVVENPIGQRRFVQRNGEVLIEINYSTRDPWRGLIELENRVWGYSYTIETVALEPLP